MAEEYKTPKPDDQYLKFPKDLPNIRFLSIDFYATDLTKDVKKIYEETISPYLSLAENFAMNKISKDTAELDKDDAKKIDENNNKLKDNFKTLMEKFKDKDAQQLVETSSVAKNSDTYQYSIYLPIPNSVDESLAHSWTGSEGLLKSALGTLGLNGLVNSVEAVGKGYFGKALGREEVLINPDLVQSYSGTGLRDISLTWSLVPNNKKEAEEIFKIIRFLKMSSSPKKIGNGFIQSPQFCEITFENETLNNSMRFSTMVIESISVNYSEAGFMETFHDGVPKQIALTVKFLERKMKTQSDWDGDTYNNGNHSNNYIRGGAY